MSAASNQFSEATEGTGSADPEKLCLVAVVKWKPEPGESILDGLSRTFGISAADMVIDEDDFLVPHRRYNDRPVCAEGEREEHVFFAKHSRGQELVRQNPEHLRGPLPAIIAFTAG